MNDAKSSSTLDESTYSASKELHGRGAPDPDVLFLMATGLGLLPAAFGVSWQLPLAKIAGVPRAWRDKTLYAAENRESTYWFLEDAPGEEEFPSSTASAAAAEPWMRGFPVWLAACSGATLCIHTSAGSYLQEGGSPVLGLVSDHINLSGRTPLRALGNSRLGPLFPDQSRIHHGKLRSIGLEHAQRLGIEVREGVVACTRGPAIETEAEREYYKRVGADFTSQGLSDPLIAMSHAGMACLSVVALIGPPDSSDVAGIVERAERVAPALEELVGALKPDMARVALEQREEL